MQARYRRHFTLFYINVFRITLFRHYSRKNYINVFRIWGKCLYFCDFACIFVILHVCLWICPSFCYLVRVRASVSSCSCWFTHFCRQNGASGIYAFFLNKKLNFSRLLARLTPVFLLKIYTLFLTIDTLFLKTEFYMDINIEIIGDIISQTSE